MRINPTNLVHHTTTTITFALLLRNAPFGRQERTDYPARAFVFMWGAFLPRSSSTTGYRAGQFRVNDGQPNSAPAWLQPILFDASSCVSPRNPPARTKPSTPTLGRQRVNCGPWLECKNENGNFRTACSLRSLLSSHSFCSL